MNKKTILLVSKNDVFIDILSIFLEGLFPAEILVADSSMQIEKIMGSEDFKNTSLAIIEEEKMLFAAGKKLDDFLIPTVLVSAGEKTQLRRNIICLKKPLDLNALTKALQVLASKTNLAHREYCQIRFETLMLAGKNISFDIYKKIEEEKYELVLTKGHVFDANNSAHFELRKNKYLYMKFEDFKLFLSSFNSQLEKITQQAGSNVSVSGSMEVSAGVHEMLSQMIPEIGFTSDLQSATKSSIDLAINAIKKDSKLVDLLSQLRKSNSEYLSWHSTALCYIACRLSNLMTWDSPNTHYKLSLAAFLHDIVVENPALMRIESKNALDALENISAEERGKFLDHAHVAAGYAREMKDFPGDVDHIIAQHHELPNGKGFPLGITHTKISPLATVFIIAHDLTDMLYDQKDKFQLKTALVELEKKYTQGYFRKVTGALGELAKKEARL